MAALARNQAGVVSRRQALSAGLTRGMVAAKVESGWWELVHEGVYKTFTGLLTRDGLLWAAVLYAGRGAYLSHGTAAGINRLTADLPSVIDVTIPGNRRVIAPKGIIIHRSTHKPMTWRPPGIPPYSIAEQTVIDLVQAGADKDEIVALVTSGFNEKHLTENHLRALAQTRKKLRRRHELDEIISLAAGGTHSPLEYRHDTNVQRAHGLPEPVKQAKFLKPDGTSGYRDRYYPQYGRLVIELDGKRFHPDDQRGLDQQRDNQSRGDRVNAALRLERRHPQGLRDRAAGGRRSHPSRLDREAQAMLARLPSG
ncbi:MAG TPA: type IV toxin-antitoxin system AbiEi family antitoxin domain-containing protein [Trebonia sp.]|nr:type IV toxin-antitoxin system AbiEi family antitoxin domain-containing protein [Trebonia sp.]